MSVHYLSLGMASSFLNTWLSHTLVKVMHFALLTQYFLEIVLHQLRNSSLLPFLYSCIMPVDERHMDCSPRSLMGIHILCLLIRIQDMGATGV